MSQTYHPTDDDDESTTEQTDDEPEYVRMTPDALEETSIRDSLAERFGVDRLRREKMDIPTKTIEPVEDGLTRRPAQDLVPISTVFRGTKVVERDDGAVIGAIEVEPQNFSMLDDEELRPHIGALAAMLTSQIKDDTRAMIVDVPHAVDYEARRDRVDEFAEKIRYRYADDWARQVQADILDERSAVINYYERTTSRRGYYIVLEVTEEDAIKNIVSADEGLASLPRIGKYFSKRQASNMDDERVRSLQISTLEQRLSNLDEALRGLGHGTTVLPATKLVQVIGDHFRTQDMFRHKNFGSIVRQSPTPQDVSQNGDPEYELNHATEESVIAPNADGEYYSRQLKTLLSPEDMTPDTAFNGDCIQRKNDRLTATLAVTGFPAIPQERLFQDLYNYTRPGIEISTATHIKRVPDKKASEEASDAKNSFESKLGYVEGTLLEEYVKEQLEQAKEVSEQQAKSPFGTFEVSIVISITGPVEYTNPKGKTIDGRQYLINRINEIQTLLADRAGVDTTHMRYLNKDGLVATAPLAKNEFEPRDYVLGDGLAAIYPWTRDNHVDPNGVEIGLHAELDEPFIMDPFARSTGHNGGIYAKVGSGKTTTLKAFANRLKCAYQDDLALIMADPLREFDGLCKTLGGDHRVIGSNTYINPLQLYSIDPAKLSRLGEGLPFDEMRDRFAGVLEMYYSIENLKNVEEKSSVWMAALDAAVEKSDIDPDDPTTYDNETIVIPDLVDEMVRMSNHPEEYVRDEHRQNEGAKDDLAKTAQKIVSYDVREFEPGGRYEFLSKPTNFNLEENDVLYLDFHLFEGKQKSGGLLMLLALHEMYAQGKRINKKVMLAFDEFHYMLKHDQSATFFEQCHRHSRHWDFALWLATQSIGEFFNEKGLSQAGKTIFELQSMHILQYISENLDKLADADEIGLSDTAVEYIKNSDPGEKTDGYADALVRIDKLGEYPLRVPMSDALNPREFALYQYDPNDHGESLRTFLDEYTDEDGNDVCEWSWTDLPDDDEQSGADTTIVENQLLHLFHYLSAELGDDAVAEVKA